MAIERSPAKAPAKTIIIDDDGDGDGAGKVRSLPLATTQPQFGQTSMPQSPLAKNKPSNVFHQPKTRPEHHREPQRPGKCLLILILDSTDYASEPASSFPGVEGSCT